MKDEIFLDGIYFVKRNGNCFYKYLEKNIDVDVNLMTPFFIAISQFLESNLGGLIKEIIFEENATGNEKKLQFIQFKLNSPCDQGFWVIVAFSKRDDVLSMKGKIVSLKWDIVEKCRPFITSNHVMPKETRNELDSLMQRLFPRH